MSNTLTITLKQHTPIIHFQHAQPGATLRATELKPKLDRFLIERITKIKDDPEMAMKIMTTKYPNWLIGKTEAEKLALNYKISIIAKKTQDYYIEQPKTYPDGSFKKKKEATETFPYPLFFGNMGKDYVQTDSIKKFEFSEGVTLTIFSFDSELRNFIDQNIGDFFALSTFGTRQSKGFGSYYPAKLDDYPFDEKLFDYKFSFSIGNYRDDEEKWKNIFSRINLFYRALRSGINDKIYIRERNEFKDDFYCKSLLFKFFKEEKRIQWEKKAIKSALNPAKLAVDQGKWPNTEPLHYSNPQNVRLVKDLLGLATEETWLSYDQETLLKYESKPEDERTFARYKSPIQFNVFEFNNGQADVFLKLNEPNLLLNKEITIAKKSDGTVVEDFLTPDQFSLIEFFDFIKTINFEEHVFSSLPIRNRATEAEYRDKKQFRQLRSILQTLTKIQL